MNRARSVSQLLAGSAFAVARRVRRLRDPLQSWAQDRRRSAGLEEEPRTLAHRPWMAQGTRSSIRLNRLLEEVRGQTYLEIGVESGLTFEAVRARSRIGVDPQPRFRTDALPRGAEHHATTSDAYFDRADAVTRIDGAFVDGLHEYRQTYRDLVSTTARLAPGGFVLIDDVVPLDAISGLPSEADFLRQSKLAGRPSGAWMGDVWRVIRLLHRCHAAEVDWRTITANNGRHQTLVWSTAAGPLVAAPEADITAVADETYEEILGDGLSDSFRPATWDAALTAFRTGRTTK